MENLKSAKRNNNNLLKKEDLLRRFVKELQAEQIVVTGSLSLFKLGVIVAEPKDLDIILVNPFQSTKDLIKLWSNIHKSTIKKSKYPSKVGLQYIIEVDGIEVDFFFLDTPINCINVDGINYKKPYDIFEAKRKIGRMKDWAQLRRISENIFSEKQLLNELDRLA